jgi:type 1 glutamine amidotransferase
MKTLLGLLTVAAVAWSGVASPASAAEKTKIVVIVGRPSHGPGDHEHNAGCKLLVKCLKEVPGVDPVFVAGGWPSDESVLEGAKSVVFYMDGGGGHPAIQNDRIDRVMRPLMEKGVGLVFIHFAVEVPKGKPGDFFREAIGAYYESGFSTNPVWTAVVKSLPDHPITRGVKPFSIKDEWYFNIRFRPDMKDVTPILMAKPDNETRKGVSSSPRGPYAHILEAAGRDEVLAWAVERPDGGRGFGFTGGHFHTNWGNDDVRTLVLNAIVWSARLDVPSDGIKCSVTADELKANLDPK